MFSLSSLGTRLYFVENFFFFSAIKDFLECLQISLPLSRKKKSQPQTMEKISNKEKHTKKSQPLVSQKVLSQFTIIKPNTSNVWSVLSNNTVILKPLSKGHTVCRTKSEISLKLLLWSHMWMFGKATTVSPQNCLMGLKEKVVIIHTQLNSLLARWNIMCTWCERMLISLLVNNWSVIEAFAWWWYF